MDDLDRIFEVLERTDVNDDAADGQESTEGDELALNPEKDAELDAMLLDGNRLQIAYKQGNDDTVGHWYGLTIGGRSANGGSIYAGYDDGELRFHDAAELKELATSGKLKLRPTTVGGLVHDKEQPVFALKFSHIRLQKKFLPLGVLLGDGTEFLASQNIFCAHIISNSVAAELKDVGYNSALRRGRRHTQPRFLACMCAYVHTR